MALITQVGLNVLLPILGCMLAGAWLDKKTGGSGLFLLLFTLLGIAAGVMNILRLGKKL
ncbi:AtpZ/AtpI family protein [Peptoniphilus sp. EMRHCC_23]